MWDEADVLIKTIMNKTCIAMYIFVWLYYKDIPNGQVNSIAMYIFVWLYYKDIPNGQVNSYQQSCTF